MNEEKVIDTQDELTVLKARADQLGISYHPSIGVEKLREKVNAALDDSHVAPSAGEPAQETKAPTRMSKKQEALKLVRVRVTCMNPNKREWEGELFTGGNSVIGSHTKYVPFDTEWHVPQVILNIIKQRQCQVFVTTKDGRGNRIRKGKLIKEFAVEILPPLTEQELKELAQRQAMAAGTAE